MTSPYYITQRPRVKKKAKAAKLSASMTSLPLVDMSSAGGLGQSGGAGQGLQPPPKMTSSSSSGDLISDYMMTVPESGMAESPKPARARSSSASSSSIAYPGAEKPSQTHIDIDLEKKGSEPSGGQRPYDDDASSKKGGDDTGVIAYPSWAYNPVGRIVYAGWQFVKEHFGEGSVGSSIFVLLSATLGAGTLAFPFAFKECGWALAIFLMVPRRFVGRVACRVSRVACCVSRVACRAMSHACGGLARAVGGVWAGGVLLDLPAGAVFDHHGQELI
jgi:hypothetical protein